jgi:hypothetical protein
MREGTEWGRDIGAGEDRRERGGEVSGGEGVMDIGGDEVEVEFEGLVVGEE